MQVNCITFASRAKSGWRAIRDWWFFLERSSDVTAMQWRFRFSLWRVVLMEQICKKSCVFVSCSRSWYTHTHLYSQSWRTSAGLGMMKTSSLFPRTRVTLEFSYSLRPERDFHAGINLRWSWDTSPSLVFNHSHYLLSPTLFLKIYLLSTLVTSPKSSKSNIPLLVDQELLKAMIRWSGGHNDGWS